MAFFIKAKKTSATVESAKLDETVCPVCKEEYDEPKILPCLHVLCVRCLEGIAPPHSLTLYCPIDEQELPLPMGGISVLPTDDRVVNLLRIAASKGQDKTQARARAPRSHTKPADRKIARRSFTEDAGPSLEEQQTKIKQQVQEAAEELRQLITKKEKETEKKVAEAFAKLKEGKPVNTTLLEDIVSAASQFGQTDQEKPSTTINSRRRETVILDLTPCRKILQSLKVEGLATIHTTRKTKLSVAEAAEDNSQAIALNYTASNSYREVADITSTLTVPISIKGMFNPGAVATSKDGRIAVSDYGNECVWLFSGAGAFECRITGDDQAAEQLESPDGVGFLSDDTLVVADSPFEEAQSLKLYDRAGGFQQCLLEMPAEEDVSFGRIFVDCRDRILVLCTADVNTVQVYDREGDLEIEFGQDELTGPEKVLYHKGQFYVSDTSTTKNRCCIKIFDQAGRLVRSFDEDKNTLGQTDNLGIDITFPILLTLDAKNDRILAYHGISKDIKVFRLDGSPVKQIKTVSGAKDIAITSDGMNIVITCGEDSILHKTVQLVRYTV